MNDWPAIKKGIDPSIFDNRAQIVADTLGQIEKDFMMQGLEISLNSQSVQYGDIHNLLVSQLEQIKLIEDYRLPALLYQLDLDQADISMKLRSSNPSNIYDVLAQNIIKRCFEKVCWRHQFKSRS